MTDVFVEAPDLHGQGFERVIAKETGRPSYHPAVLLKPYIYGYFSRLQSTRRLEREAFRNIEVVWPIGRLAPDHKTIEISEKTIVRRSGTLVRSSLHHTGR